MRMTEDSRDVARSIARMYHTLSPEELGMLADIMVPMKFSKGDIILKENEVCRHMLYVSKGMVRQFYFKNNKDVTEHFSYETKIVMCIESFLQQEPSRLMVEALEPCLLFGIPYDGLQELTRKSVNIELLFRKFLEHCLIDSQIHADSVRFESATDRYFKLLESRPQIFLRAPLVHIASYLQMSPETLSRIRTAHLKEEEKVEKSGKTNVDKEILGRVAPASSITKAVSKKLSSDKKKSREEAQK